MRMLTMVLMAVVLVSGCTPAPPTSQAPKEDKHVHGIGPNGGRVFDLGVHHAEVVVNPTTQELTLYVLGEDEKTAEPVTAKDLQATTLKAVGKDGQPVPALTVPLSASPKEGETGGKSSRFVGKDAGLVAGVEYRGTVTGVIESKPVKAKFGEKE